MKKDNLINYINKFFIMLFIFAILTGYLLGETCWDKIISVSAIFIILGILRLTAQAVVVALTKNYHWVMIICICLTILFTFILEIQRVVVPVVTSELIELPYDLSSEDMVKNGKMEITNKTGKFILEKKGNLYRIYFPRRIKQIEAFSTSYDRAGKHIHFIHWIEGAHFIVKDNYIESRHKLGENINNGIGRHMIVYRYRITPLEFLKRPTKILINMLI